MYIELQHNPKLKYKFFYDPATQPDTPIIRLFRVNLNLPFPNCSSLAKCEWLILDKEEEYIVLARKYRVVRDLIQGGSITTLYEIFDILPKTILARDMHLNYKSLLKKVDYPSLFTLGDIAQLASLVGISEDSIFNIAKNSIKSNSKKTKDKPSE